VCVHAVCVNVRALCVNVRALCVNVRAVCECACFVCVCVNVHVVCVIVILFITNLRVLRKILRPKVGGWRWERLGGSAILHD